MASGEEPLSAADDRHDFTRDVESPRDTDTPSGLSSVAQQHVQSSYAWMRVWACLLLVMLVLTGGIFVNDFLWSRDPVILWMGIILPLFMLGLPFSLLLLGANAFARSVKNNDLQALAKGFRIQHWLLTMPLMLIAFGFAIGFLFMLSENLVGVQFNV